MLLETELGLQFTNPNLAQLTEAVMTLGPRRHQSDFLILGPQDNQMFYIQTLYTEDDLYLVEVQYGSLDEHYELTHPINGDQLIELLSLYLSHADIKTNYTWQKMIL